MDEAAAAAVVTACLRSRTESVGLTVTVYVRAGFSDLIVSSSLSEG